MALVGVEFETLVSEPDALTTRPPPSSLFITGSLRKNGLRRLHGKRL